MRPPPGGRPYLATISGEAMRLDLPNTRVPIVVGILSSSTQTYSGSLATSGKRGFLMSSHLGSAALISTLGSSTLGRPTSSRRLAPPQALRVTPTTTRAITRRSGTRTLISSLSIADSTGSILGPGLPREALLARPVGARDRHPPREERRSRDGRDPGDVEVGDPAALQEDGHEPARHLERLPQGHRAVGTHQELLRARLAVEEDLVDVARVHALEALGLVHGQGEHEGHTSQVGPVRGEIGGWGDRDLDPASRDAHAVLRVGLVLALDGDEERLGESLLDALHLRVAEDLLVSAEDLAVIGMAEFFALAEDRELLAGQHALLLAQVHVEMVAVHLDDDPLHGREGADHVLEHEAEGGADLVGDARGGGRSDREQRRQGRGGGPRKQWTADAHRRRSAGSRRSRRG